MVTINLDTLEDDGDDDGWRFDPENPPEQWTTQMFRRLSIGDIRRLREPDNGILSPESQKSFDERSAEWTRSFNAQLKPALASLPKFKLPTFVYSSPSSALLDESIRKSRQALAEQLDVSKSLGVTALPEVEWKLPTVEPTHHSPVIDLTTSAADLEQQTSTEVEHLAVLESIREVLVGQERAAARGAFFYILIGLATTLAGVATLVTMSTWAERWWTIGITAAIGLVAWAAAAIVKARQKPKKNQASQ